MPWKRHFYPVLGVLPLNDLSPMPYQELDPDRILTAIESIGLRCTGQLLALNSYENRVYQVGMEDAPALVAKFYRPARWSDDQILEEHRFSLQLAELEIPVAPPLVLDGRSLHHHGAYRFALYSRKGGRPPDLENPDHLQRIGRLLGRMHRVGATQPHVHRPTLSIQEFGRSAQGFLLDTGFLPAHLREDYRFLSDLLLEKAAQRFQEVEGVARLRLHGDGHVGNILWDDGPWLVDLDDSRNGPAVQDLWLLLSGEREQRTETLRVLLEGYEDFYEFNPVELRLVEALRALRMLHHAAWMARRWGDPAFPAAFPWFNGGRYWEEHLDSLREQVTAFDEPPLRPW